MNIGFYKWSETPDDVKARLLHRAQADIENIADKVAPILADVRARGDEALLDYAKRFDKAELSSLRVSEEEIAQACKTVAPSLKQAIDRCIGNVRKFHEEQMRRVEDPWMFEIEPGVFAGEKVTPISSVGLYVPGGKNLYPSTLYMLAVPAVVAKVPKVIMLTPPRPDGSVSDVILYAAHASGITEIYKVGGAQAIAAMAYGTQTIPKVHKVLGPCSPFGAAAKQMLGGVINPGMPAGPSDSLVLCDDSADPDNTVWDVLNEAEHGPDSAGILVTHDENLASYVHKKLQETIAALPEPQRGYLETNMAAYSGVILTRSLEESIGVSNLYAPEHVVLKVRNPDAILPKIVNAGEILIGENSPSSLGNYGIGVNHVLPTGGMAHSYSCTSVWDYLKRTSIARVTAEGLNALTPAVTAMADYEGFPAHGNVLRLRKIYND
ncbi:MAG: histidinol dehydrogenase [Micavibrio aeruginosavorus]|uniref:Histidinol dehydrogenase n=1 Tax=Micavibrio aeruginosavorus TaxID=349221 RepID=A0A2W5C406_9BACT|nr:MAG: histidinol dehydrogenase [Micavibrio aeruginosavorus]